MATYRGLFKNEISGRLGNLVFYKRYGETYVRKAPVFNNRKLSDKQKAIIARFTALVYLYKSFRGGLFSHIWKCAVKGTSKSGYNFFIQCNKNIFDETGEILDYSQLQVSQGGLNIPLELTVKTKNKTIILKWKNNKRYSGKESDSLFLFFMYDDGTYRYLISDNLNIIRYHEYAEINLPQEDNLPVHMYCFFGSQYKDKFSPSRYYRLNWDN